MCVGAWVSGCGWVVGRGCVWLGLGTCEYVHFCAHVCTCVHMCAMVCTCVYVRTYICAHGRFLVPVLMCVGGWMGGCGWLWVNAGGYICVGGWMEVGVGGCGWAWVFVATFKCTHMCTCVHMCARVCTCGCVHVCARCGCVWGREGGEFVLVVGCICVEGWWLRRGLSSLYLQRLLATIFRRQVKHSTSTRIETRFCLSQAAS